MTEETAKAPADTRRRILEAALDLFVSRGYQRTTLRQIAERIGLTKAAVLYHFPAKEHILGALSEPLLEDLTAALDRAEGRPLAEAREICLEGVLDSFLTHRQTLLMLRYDLSILTRQPETYERFLDTFTRAYQIIAGPDADLAARIRGVQAFAAMGDPLVMFPDVSDDDMRELVLRGARELLGMDSGPAARRAGDGRPRGRPRSLDAERLATARRLYAGGAHSVTEIAERLGVSRATLYRHLDRA